MEQQYNRVQTVNKSSRMGTLGGLFCLIQIMNLIGYISNSMNMETVFSLVSQLYIVLNYLAFLLYMISPKRNKRAGESIVLFLFMLFSSILSYLASAGVGIYTFLITLSGYLALPMYLILVREIPTNQRTLKYTYFAAIGTGIFFLYRGFVNPEYILGTQALSMGFFNSNQAAIFLVQNFSILIAFYPMKKKSPARVLILLLCVLEIWLIYKTQSRTALLCVVILVVGYVFRKMPLSRRSIRVLFIAPMVFVFLFMFLSNNAYISSIEILGKPILNGRNLIFYYALLNLQGHYLFGNFSSSQFANLHNAYLSVLVSVGVLGFFLFLLFFWREVVRLWKQHSRNEVTYLAFLGFMLLFLEGCAEAAILVSGSMYAVATAQLLFLINYGESV